MHVLPKPLPLDTWSRSLCHITREAGKIIMGYYGRECAVSSKKDLSPVTEADVAAHHYIAAQLKELAPDIPVISEEDASNHADSAPSRFWLVDPLDGTKSFIARTGEFTVNIGLIQHRVPILGAVYVPVRDVLYGCDSSTAFREENGKRITIEIAPKISSDGYVVVASKSHRSPADDAFIQTLPVKSLTNASSSLKFCLVAEGKADIYPRFGTTMEWDTAAAHAVLTRAGGSVLTTEGDPFLYGKPDFRNGNFIAYGARPAPTHSR